MSLHAILSELISKDPSLLEEPKKLKGLLLDCSENRFNRDVYILILLLESGIISKLNKVDFSYHEESRAVARIYDKYGLDKQLTTRAIRIWIKVMYESKRGSSQKNTSFSDPHLEEAILASIYKEKGEDFILSMDDLESLTVLRGDDRGITNLVGIEKLVNIEHISLQNNSIIDISPLLLLKNLKTLFIGRNKIQFASVINEFDCIQALDLSYNPIVDFASLSDRTLMLMFDTIGEDINLKAQVYTLLSNRGYELNVE